MVICACTIFVLVIDIWCLILWYWYEIWWFLHRSCVISGIRPQQSLRGCRLNWCIYHVQTNPVCQIRVRRVQTHQPSYNYICCIDFHVVLSFFAGQYKQFITYQMNKTSLPIHLNLKLTLGDQTQRARIYAPIRLMKALTDQGTHQLDEGTTNFFQNSQNTLLLL